MARKVVRTQVFTCGECRSCTPVTTFFTLSVEGKPTLGKCPHVADRKVLLSEKSCSNFKSKK